jgi:hypothetical protein
MKDEKSVKDLMNQFEELVGQSDIKPPLVKVSKEGHLVLDPLDPTHAALYENLEK